MILTHAGRAKQSTTTAGRRDFQQMIADAAHYEFDTVYVYKLDRFARDHHEFDVNRKRLKERDVTLRSVA